MMRPLLLFSMFVRMLSLEILWTLENEMICDCLGCISENVFAVQFLWPYLFVLVLGTGRRNQQVLKSGKITLKQTDKSKTKSSQKNPLSLLLNKEKAFTSAREGEIHPGKASNWEYWEGINTERTNRPETSEVLGLSGLRVTFASQGANLAALETFHLCQAPQKSSSCI